jgi:hypothetical protein
LILIVVVSSRPAETADARALLKFAIQTTHDQSAKTIKTGLIAISQRFSCRDGSHALNCSGIRHDDARSPSPSAKEGRLCRLHAAESFSLTIHAQPVVRHLHVARSAFSFTIAGDITSFNAAAQLSFSTNLAQCNSLVLNPAP